jgi:hypothetical protein
MNRCKCPEEWVSYEDEQGNWRVTLLAIPVHEPREQEQ